MMEKLLVIAAFLMIWFAGSMVAFVPAWPVAAVAGMMVCAGALAIYVAGSYEQGSGREDAR